MSRDNLEAIRQGYEAFNRGDVEGVLEGLHPDIEWVVPDFLPEPDTYRGPEGVRKFFQGWTDAFEGFNVEIEELGDYGEHVVALARVGGRLRGSDLTLHGRTFAQVWTFRGEQVVRVEMFPDKKAALEAAGRAG